MLPHTMLIQYDSGQAGMTVYRRFSTFYETIRIDLTIVYSFLMK